MGCSITLQLHLYKVMKISGLFFKKVMQTSRLRHHHPSLQNIQTLPPTSPHAPHGCTAFPLKALAFGVTDKAGGGLLRAILGRMPPGGKGDLAPLLCAQRQVTAPLWASAFSL